MLYLHVNTEELIECQEREQYRKADARVLEERVFRAVLDAPVPEYGFDDNI